MRHELTPVTVQGEVREEGGGGGGRRGGSWAGGGGWGRYVDGLVKTAREESTYAQLQFLMFISSPTLPLPLLPKYSGSVFRVRN